MLRRVTRTPRPFPFLSLLGPLLRPSSGLLAASLALAACGAAPPAREPARLGLSDVAATAMALAGRLPAEEMGFGQRPPPAGALERLSPAVLLAYYQRAGAGASAITALLDLPPSDEIAPGPPDGIEAPELALFLETRRRVVTAGEILEGRDTRGRLFTARARGTKVGLRCAAVLASGSGAPDRQHVTCARILGRRIVLVSAVARAGPGRAGETEAMLVAFSGRLIAALMGLGKPPAPENADPFLLSPPASRT
ncbi:Hypothetical protein HVPorG_03593 [Roseomonas mucosa]|uniref:Lipoprotein n=2 Tax=Roseomonas TaxID=125216 RepID=A0A1S8D7B5_9PROT|nr:hypothetical protein [Roseomonas mucosa]ATR19844.1 hypothetical protein CTJ15_05700 [Roseomonas sp. FDAARGOS_362]AWV23734.1 Hypothetical protein RADP37_03593 [Roseomonas mucosa]MDT8276368.1 hypothetical protein [Roseomonas mucosa]ONH83644.1 hypothetical protein APZ41_008425 [Roseomonas mucosa]QDD95968.1 Hypothetical protein HVIM_03593 [Roseomonas mucosa]